MLSKFGKLKVFGVGAEQQQRYPLLTRAILNVSTQRYANHNNASDVAEHIADLIAALHQETDPDLLAEVRQVMEI